MEKIYTGVLVGAKDSRDFPDLVGAISEPFDWSVGYDVEADVGFKLEVNDQGKSYSCVGQAKAKDREVKEGFDFMYKPYSARSIYALREDKGREGMHLRDACNIENRVGVNTKKYVPDYKTESEMRVDDFSDKDYPKTKSSSYFSIPINGSIDLFAKAIRDYKGVIFAYDGWNKSGILDTHVVLPDSPNTVQWSHCVFAIGAKMVNGEKRIYFLNSWGKGVGVDGCQYLTTDQISPNLNNFSPVTWQLYGTLDEETINNNLETMKEQFIKDNTGKVLLVQNVQGDGEVSIFKDGSLYKGTKEDVLLTYLIMTEGTGVPKELYEALEVKQIKK
jgi:hypothetical protein